MFCGGLTVSECSVMCVPDLFSSLLQPYQACHHHGRSVSSMWCWLHQDCPSYCPTNCQPNYSQYPTQTGESTYIASQDKQARQPIIHHTQKQERKPIYFILTQTGKETNIFHPNTIRQGNQYFIPTQSCKETNISSQQKLARKLIFYPNTDKATDILSQRKHTRKPLFHNNTTRQGNQYNILFHLNTNRQGN